jgi:hypothetical protein
MLIRVKRVINQKHLERKTTCRGLIYELQNPYEELVWNKDLSNDDRIENPYSRPGAATYDMLTAVHGTPPPPGTVNCRTTPSDISYRDRQQMTSMHSLLTVGFQLKLKLKLKLVYGRQSVGQSVLVPGSHLEPVTTFLLSLWWFRVSLYGVPSLTRRRIYNLLYNCFRALSEQSLLDQSSAELTAIFYYLIWDSPNLEGQVPVFISLRNRVVSYTLGNWVPFLSPLTTRRATVEVF